MLQALPIKKNLHLSEELLPFYRSLKKFCSDILFILVLVYTEKEISGVRNLKGFQELKSFSKFHGD
jgi:hypothetical protein